MNIVLLKYYVWNILRNGGNIQHHIVNLAISSIVVGLGGRGKGIQVKDTTNITKVVEAHHLFAFIVFETVVLYKLFNLLTFFTFSNRSPPLRAHSFVRWSVSLSEGGFLAEA